MEIGQYYAATIILPLLVLLAHTLMLRLPALTESSEELLRHYVLRKLSSRLQAQWLATKRKSPSAAVMICVFFILVNVCSATIDISKISGRTTLRIVESATFLRRLGGLTLINSLILFATGQFHPIAALLLISYIPYRRAHACVGFTVMTSAVLHCFLGLGSQTNGAQTGGIIAVSSLGILCFSSILQFGFRDKFYEVFATAHYYLSIIVLVTTWIHLSHLSIFSPPKLYLFLASCFYGFVRLFRLLCMIHANFSNDGKKSKAVIRDINGDIEIRIRLARPVNFLPGQFIYLRLPFLRAPSTIFQSHPFQIAWDYFEMDEQTIIVNVEPRQGFTLGLAAAARQWPEKSHSAFVEGPYGHPVRADNCEVAIVFATGIGIAGQLIHVRELLRQDKVERVLLYWEVHDEKRRHLVKGHMDELLVLDEKHLSEVKVYVTGKLPVGMNMSDTLSHGNHKRVNIHGQRMDVKEIITSEVQKWLLGGKRIFTSYCTDDDTAKIIEDSVGGLVHGKVSAGIGEIRIERSGFRLWKSPAQSPKMAGNGSHSNKSKPTTESTRSPNEQVPVRPRRPSTAYTINAV